MYPNNNAGLMAILQMRRPYNTRGPSNGTHPGIEPVVDPGKPIDPPTPEPVAQRRDPVALARSRAERMRAYLQANGQMPVRYGRAIPAGPNSPQGMVVTAGGNLGAVNLPSPAGTAFGAEPSTPVADPTKDPPYGFGGGGGI